MKNYIFRSLHFLGCLLLVISWSSCRDDFETTPSSGELVFSRDTVFLDTVFTNIGSSTYTLKVYNTSNQAINIPSVDLARGENSRYRLNVDGLPGKSFENVEILARDSIFIFIESTIRSTDLPENENSFLYTDAIQFDGGPNLQEVQLVTLVKDAIFLFPRRDQDGVTEKLNLGVDPQGNEILIEGFVLDDEELLFTAEKPYVIYSYAAVPSGKTLQIEAGARIHFHEASGILVGSGGRLEVNGSLSADQTLLENEVIFEGDRLEPDFAEVPGQWGTIWLAAGSSASLGYATIKNSTLGLLAEGGADTSDPAFQLKNVQIYNSSVAGIYTVAASILGENLVIGNSGISSLWLRAGGSYDFTHCTFTNYWTRGFRNAPAVRIENFLETENGIFTGDLTKANFTNCIIYGNRSEELGLSQLEGSAFNFNFNHCLIRFDNSSGNFSSNPLYDFSNETFYRNIILNASPDFVNPERNDLRIRTSSAAVSQGSQNGALQVPFDLLGVPRPPSPDLGAYQSIPD